MALTPSPLSVIMTLVIFFKNSLEVSPYIGADVVNYAWKLSQLTEEGVLVGSGDMKTRFLNI